MRGRRGWEWAHATLRPESDLRIVVHSSHPRLAAGPCERKQGLDTFSFSDDKHTKFSSRLSLTRLQQRGN